MNTSAAHFALRLDVYSESQDKRALEFGEGGWRIDSHGYDFDYNGTVKADLWRGGFRVPLSGELIDRMGRDHISRVPLFALTGFTVPTGDLLFALPRRLNTANSPAPPVRDRMHPVGSRISVLV